jgi:hypothetical protein
LPSEEEVLGFFGQQYRDEPNPKQIQVLLSMTPPRIVKEVQRLTGRLTALNIFITRLGNEVCHFSKF